jgi:hypothetical protein
MAPSLDFANAERWSSLARIVDPGIPSNRLAVGGTLTAALVVGLLLLLGLDAGLSPFSAAIGVFLAWAIGRELDPDHPTAAAIAMPVSLGLLLLLGPSSLLVSAGVLLGVRMTAGTVGSPLRSLDIVGIVALSALLGTTTIGFVGAAAMVVGVFVDEPRRSRSMAIIAASTTAFVAASLIAGVEWSWTAPDAAGWATLVVGAVAVVAVVPAAPPSSLCDRRTVPVRRERVTAARGMAGIAVLAGFALAGQAGIAALAGTTVAALAGTAIRRMLSYRRPIPSA